MCLLVDENKTTEMKKNFGRVLNVWKILNVNIQCRGTDIFVRSPMQYGYYWRPGKTTCHRPTAQYPYKYRTGRYHICSNDTVNSNGKIEINSGIHVCLTRQAAREYIREMKQHYHKNVNLKIFRCEAHIVSLIAAGTCEYHSTHDKMAVFHCVTIGPEDWKKALNGDFR